MAMKRTNFKPRSKPLQARKSVNKVSAKRKAQNASPEGQAGKRHMARVASLGSVISGKRPVEVHHCRHLPPADYNNGMGPYKQLPAAGRKSSNFDTIPLTPEEHRERHLNPDEWLERHGPDYEFLPIVAEMLRATY